jgi:2-oxoisovalerate dehydrogenase E1 component alpha subunit
MAIESVADRAEGYGMPGTTIDGTDIGAVYETTFEAAVRARGGHGPTLIEAKVERYLPHTSDDDDSRYRPRQDIEAARQRDPLKRLREELLEKGHLTNDTNQTLMDDAKRTINEATDIAESTPFPGTETFYDHVYSSSGGPSSQ